MTDAPIPVRRRARAARCAALTILLAVLVAGCTAATPAHPRPASGLLALPRVLAGDALVDAANEQFSGPESGIVATFAVEDGLSGAVAISGRKCGLALAGPRDRSASLTVVDFGEISSTTTIQRLGSVNLTKLIGPNISAAYANEPERLGPVTIYCGVRGVVVDLGPTTAPVVTAGAATALSGSGSRTSTLLIAAKSGSGGSG